MRSQSVIARAALFVLVLGVGAALVAFLMPSAKHEIWFYDDEGDIKAYWYGCTNVRASEGSVQFKDYFGTPVTRYGNIIIECQYVTNWIGGTPRWLSLVGSKKVSRTFQALNVRRDPDTGNTSFVDATTHRPVLIIGHTVVE